jgi:hypothetical protein
MQKRKPTVAKPSNAAGKLSAAAIIGFSLTLVGAGVAMLAGFVPQRMLPALDNLDATVVLLFVPLCALTLAILFEAVRTTFNGGLHRAVPVKSGALEPWRPGRGEG